jgi:hypothetical protein
VITSYSAHSSRLVSRSAFAWARPLGCGSALALSATFHHSSQDKQGSFRERSTARHTWPCYTCSLNDAYVRQFGCPGKPRCCFTPSCSR